MRHSDRHKRDIVSGTAPVSDTDSMLIETRMNPGGRFAPQSQLSETAKDGALLRGFWGATLDLGRGSGGGPASLLLTVVKILQKKGTDRRTDGHDSVGVPQIRDPSESDRSGKMGSTAQDLLVLEFLVLGQ